MPELRRSQTHRINGWSLWREIAEFYGFDPYEECEWGEDIGGGDSIDYEYIGEYPENE